MSYISSVDGIFNSFSDLIGQLSSDVIGRDVIGAFRSVCHL